jgi:hypothetical protein
MNMPNALRGVLAAAGVAVVASTAVADSGAWTDHGLITHLFREGKALCVMGKINIAKQKNPKCDHPDNWACMDYAAMTDAEEKKLSSKITGAFLGGKPVAVHLTGKCDGYDRAQFDLVQVK